jgi:hypothetical protein
VAQRFTAAIKALLSMTASAAEGIRRASREFFSSLFSRQGVSPPQTKSPSANSIPRVGICHPERSEGPTHFHPPQYPDRFTAAQSPPQKIHRTHAPQGSS